MTAGTKKLPKLLRNAYTALGILALFLGITSTGWLILMAGQWALPWSSLSIMAPPGQAPPSPILPD